MKTARLRKGGEGAASKSGAKKPSATSPRALFQLGVILLSGARAIGEVIDRTDIAMNTLDAMGMTAAEARKRYAARQAAEASYRLPAPPAPPLPVGLLARAGEVTFRVGLLTLEERAAYDHRMSEPATSSPPRG